MERGEGWTRAVEFVVKSELQGDLYEFGCYRGESLAYFWQKAAELEARFKRRSIDRFFAFDSFAGMPTPEPEDHLEEYDFALGTLKPGCYAGSLEQVTHTVTNAGMEPSRFVPIVGFYKDSLPRRETEKAVAGSTCALLHIDCDLESSAFDALTFMTGRLQDGCVVLFDDWFLYRGRPDKGEQSAFARWLPRSGYSAMPYFTYSWVGAAFILHRA